MVDPHFPVTGSVTRVFVHLLGDGAANDFPFHIAQPLSLVIQFPGAGLSMGTAAAIYQAATCFARGFLAVVPLGKPTGRHVKKFGCQRRIGCGLAGAAPVAVVNFQVGAAGAMSFHLLPIALRPVSLDSSAKQQIFFVCCCAAPLLPL